MSDETCAKPYPKTAYANHKLMKFEDFVCQDNFAGANGRLLPRKHVIAIGATFLTASVLFFVLLGSQDLSSNAASALNRQTEYSGMLSFEGGRVEDNPQAYIDEEETLIAQNAGAAAEQPRAESELEEIIDPKVSLTDAIASITGYQREEHVSYDNYEDEVPESLLTDSDSALVEEIQTLAASQGSKASSRWYSEDIQRGDTISSIFSDLNISYNVMEAITKHKDAGSSLTKLTVGNKLSFLIDEENRLLSFVKQLNKSEQMRFYRTDPNVNDFTVVREPLNAHLLNENTLIAQAALEASPIGSALTTPAAEPEVPAYKKRGRLVVVDIKKGQAFSTAAHNSGLTYSEINQITKLFKGRIQFSRHIQPGDSMRVLFSEDKGEGTINAVEFNLSRLGKIAAYRNLADNKYYDENGYNADTANFRRFPFDGTARITSAFNPSRRHPVTGRVRAHNGTDFGLKVGTPVLAPADGIVDKAAFSKSAGFYIVIRHAGGYSTVYMHLSKLGVKAGQRVKIGQVIARSGNTGLSTGPHLHYELRINNRPVNAMRVKLPKNEDISVSQKQKQRFQNNVALYKKELYQDDLMAANP